MGFAFQKADWLQYGQSTQEEQDMGRKDSSKAAHRRGTDVGD